ncbi:unnamed protein product [Amoebophrya sp. A120]|nr:unnamed protein product [Amoebophrya sp. A120]|eukprot:GSA120T00012228001.1
MFANLFDQQLPEFLYDAPPLPVFVACVVLLITVLPTLWRTLFSGGDGTLDNQDHDRSSSSNANAENKQNGRPPADSSSSVAPTRKTTAPAKKFRDERAIVVVIGDVGRSPRTMTHAVEFARNNVYVSLIGYYPKGTKNNALPQELTDLEDKIDFVQLPAFVCPFPKLPYIFYLLWRVFHDLWHFWFALGSVSFTTYFRRAQKISWILIQNPPMVPQLFACKLVQMFLKVMTLACLKRKQSRTRRFPTIAVDFHNFGFTILSLKLGERSPITKVLKFAEKLLARTCVDVGFTVTHAMKEELVKNWNLKTIPIGVLHDRARPPTEVLRDVVLFWDSLADRGFLKELHSWNKEKLRQFFEETADEQGKLQGSTPMSSPGSSCDQREDNSVGGSPCPSSSAEDENFPKKGEAEISSRSKATPSSFSKKQFNLFFKSPPTSASHNSSSPSDISAENCITLGDTTPHSAIPKPLQMRLTNRDWDPILTSHYAKARRECCNGKNGGSSISSTSRSSAPSSPPKKVLHLRVGSVEEQRNPPVPTSVGMFGVSSPIISPSHSSAATFLENDPDTVKVVSSTSWTVDEDFTDLFHSLPEIAKRMKPKKKLVVFITGQGELRGFWQKHWQEKREMEIGKDDATGVVVKLKDRIRVLFLFLPWADYPQLLQACDYGLCMHQSSSGLDLPMKVVDMFGFAELPVVAKNFQALPELVVDHVNGFTFTTSDELRDHLVYLTNNHADEQFAKLGRMRVAIHESFHSPETTWPAVWKREVLARYYSG